MKLIKTNLDVYLWDCAEAFVTGNQIKLREIRKREDDAKARRSMFRLINGKCRV